MNKAKIFDIKCLFVFLLYIQFISKLGLSLSISPNEKYACFLYLYNKYYLFNLEDQKLVKEHEFQEHYDNVFFISSEKIALSKENRIHIMDSILLKKEAEFSFNQKIKDIKVVKENEAETYFLIFTDYSIRYFKYEKNTQKITLLNQKNLVKFFDVVIKNNQVYVANNVFISIFTQSEFLWMRWLNQKNIKFNEAVYSIDVGSNKFVVLHYISMGKRKVGIYTLDGFALKIIDLEGNYTKIWFDFNQKEFILFDESNSIKSLSQDGTVKESSIFGGRIMGMQKYSEGFILVFEEADKPSFAVLDKNFNSQ
ncbi:MAG: hypothetical protein RMJ36_03555 [Candidatus Calescibacterium sp.]|nr:hypothetical protein [Candidatus Calescibacterium sp.]MDW8132713.1 hypothetical protein [Candidatus Calescibacterium sp.]